MKSAGNADGRRSASGRVNKHRKPDDDEEGKTTGTTIYIRNPKHEMRNVKCDKKLWDADLHRFSQISMGSI